MQQEEEEEEYKDDEEKELDFDVLEKKGKLLELKENRKEWHRSVQQLNRMIQMEKEKAESLVVTLEDWEQKVGRLTFLYEMKQGMKLGIIWIFLTAATFLSLFAAYQQHRYVLFLINLYGFLAVWRCLYVREAPWSQWIAGAIVVGTTLVV